MSDHLSLFLFMVIDPTHFNWSDKQSGKLPMDARWIGHLLKTCVSGASLLSFLISLEQRPVLMCEGEEKAWHLTVEIKWTS